MIRRALLALACLCAAAGFGDAEPLPYLVRNIGTTPVGVGAGRLARVGHRLFFVGNDGVHGAELWTSDGSAAGTTIVADVVPGPGSAGLAGLTPVGDRLSFVAGTTARAVWESDGTAAGTRPVSPAFARVFDESGRDNPRALTDVAGTLFFVATDDTGTALWRGDGHGGATPVATVAHEAGVRQADRLAVVGATLFFVAPGDEGDTLSKYEDGEPSVVTAFDPAAGSVSLDQLTAAGDTLYFTVSRPGDAGTLWRSDGTDAGTSALVDGAISIVGGVDGTLLFVRTTGSGSELWRSDGSVAGTMLLTALADGGTVSSRETVAANGALFFVLGDDLHGSELWRTDGSAAGTHLVGDLNPGRPGSDPSALTVMDGRVFFVAYHALVGTALWATDGTAAGTRLVADPSPSLFPDPAPAEPTAVDGTLFFTADDGTTGTELWATDGTTAGTHLVRDLYPGDDGSDPTGLVAAGGRLFFLTQEGGVPMPWSSDGTRAGTVRLSADGADRLVPWNGSVFFLVPAAGHDALWRSDGTTAGTAPVADLAATGVSCLVAAGNRLYFAAFGDPEVGFEPWQSDGTTAGTSVLRDVFPGPRGSFPCDFTAAGDAVFFTAEDGSTGVELWRTDGSAAGTARVVDLSPGAAASVPQNLTAVDGALVFTAGQAAPDGNAIEGLWRSDGTAAGTVLLTTLPAVHGPIVRVGALYLFAAYTDATGYELWRSDGTPAGTGLLVDIDPGPDSSDPSELTDVDGTLFFVAGDPVGGTELWKSDGTSAGTVRVRDIAPGVAGSAPRGLAAVRGQLFFSATDRTHGRELWRSDGTAAGTVLVADVHQGPVGSNPADMTLVGDLLFFSADDGTSGRELWALPLPSPVRPPACGDGRRDPGEECDDGNATSGDGCSASCRLECRTDADCDDGGDCTIDACVVGVCTHADRERYDGAVCHVDELLTVPGCEDDALRRRLRLAARVSAVDALLRRAGTASKPAPLVRRAHRKMTQLAAMAKRLGRRAHTAACGTALAAAARERASLIEDLLPPRH